MAEFKGHDDRVSNMEAPLTSGFYMDASGNRWANRPDNVVDKYMSKVTLTQDEHWQYKKYLDGRQWFELSLLLDRLLQTATTDDAIRINRAKEVADGILSDNRR